MAKAPDPRSSQVLRQVTVVFADLSGFTELSSELDPEDLHELLSHFLATCDEIIERFGGTVDQHLGDGVMAVFGAPFARSNDAEHAVRAALAIHEEMPALSASLGRPLTAHIGVASGQVLIAAAADRQSVTGQAVNLAARLSDLAAAGETLISDAAHAALPELVCAEPIGETHVKGMPRSVRVWRVTGLQTNGRCRPFVGRTAEMRRMEELLEATLDAGRGAPVLVRGEPGIGKTRLVEEVRRRAAERGFICHTSRILDFGAGRGADPIRSMTLGVIGNLGPIEANPAEQVVRAGLLDPDQAVFLNDLLERPQPEAWRRRLEAMESSARRRAFTAMLGSLISNFAHRKPLLLTVEDVQWADGPTLTALQSVVAVSIQCPAMVVLTGRTERGPSPPTWCAEAGSSLVILDLEALRPHEALELAGRYGDASSGYVRECIARAGGNPLFLEQLLRSAEVEGDTVPGSVQSVVLARMDRLDPADQEIIQTASVLGQRFSEAALRHLQGGRQIDCGRLLEEALIQPDDGDYLFAHALVRDAVYASLLKSRRKALHGRAAMWFETSDPGLRAEHLAQAEDPTAAAAFFEAARAEAGKHRKEVALRYVERGLHLADERSLSFDLACLRGDLLRELGSIDASIDAFRHALELSRERDDTGLAWLGLAQGMRIVDRYDEALEALDRAQAALNDATDAAFKLARVHEMRGNIYFPLGKLERCLAEHEQALALARGSGSLELESRALGGVGDAHYARGRIRSAQQYFARCVELCREHGLTAVQVVNAPMLALSFVFMNDVRGGVEAARESIEAAQDIAQLRAELLAQQVMLTGLMELGDLEAASVHTKRAQHLVARLGARRFEPENLCNLAKIAHARGQRQEALTHLEEALAIARATGMGYIGPTVLGAFALITSDPSARQSSLAEAEAVLADGAVGHNHLWFYRDAIEASLGAGEWEDAEHYASRLEAYTEAEPLPWSTFYAARGRALAAAGRGARDERTKQRLGHLRDEALSAGLWSASHALERCLDGSGQPG